MPTYVYVCKACEDRFEIVQKMVDASLTDCEKCGGTIRRVIFPPAVVYKGSGFYITDYKNGGRKPEGQSEGKSEGKSESTSESKSDSDSSSASSPSTTSSSDTKTESKPAARTETKKD